MGAPTRTRRHTAQTRPLGTCSSTRPGETQARPGLPVPRLVFSGRQANGFRDPGQACAAHAGGRGDSPSRPPAPRARRGAC